LLAIVVVLLIVLMVGPVGMAEPMEACGTCPVVTDSVRGVALNPYTWPYSGAQCPQISFNSPAPMFNPFVPDHVVLTN